MKVEDNDFPDFDPSADNEEFWDEEIQPLIAKASALCAARGVPFICVGQYYRGKLCSSYFIPPGNISFIMEAMIAMLLDKGAVQYDA